MRVRLEISEREHERTIRAWQFYRKNDQQKAVGKQKGMSEQRDKLFNGQTCLADDCPECAAVKFFVIGNGGLRGWGVANQDNVTAALSKDFKANLTERLGALRAGDDWQFTQAATSTNSTQSSGSGSPRSRITASCKAIASRTFSRASSRVLPWLMQPGRLGTSATTKPSSPGYRRTRLVMY